MYKSIKRVSNLLTLLLISCLKIVAIVNKWTMVAIIYKQITSPIINNKIAALIN